MADIQWVGKERQVSAPASASLQYRPTPACHTERSAGHVAREDPNPAALSCPGLTCRSLKTQTVIVRSNKNNIYRSSDEGKSWEKQNWKMEGAQAEEDGKSGVLSFHVSPSDTSKVRDWWDGVG